jgi:hypothetical protein
MLSKRKMMGRAKEDFFRKPRRGIEHRQEVKPRANRTDAENAARLKGDKFAEVPEAGDGEMREVDQKQVVFDRITEGIVGATVGGLVGFGAGKLVGMAYGGTHQMVWTFVLYGLVAGAAINVLFLHKAPK